ncbi:alanine--tRNA ligase [candidate division SR1 bacterium]|nr:alanine--tRNA ligase [candidate division SR1 bacterium]
MKNLTSNQFRQLRTDFWTSKNHINLPEASLIADKDSTALFNVAGMQPIIPYLMGKEHPLGKRLFNIQKCIRTVDIDEVGDNSHLTFFEMMGNWSLGDYFKKEAVARSREFLTKYIEIDPRKIAVTVFAGDQNAPKDSETAGYRESCFQSANIPAKISYLPADNNWRSPGPVGPCGPDTEIFYRVGESEFPSAESNVGNDENNWMEIRNNVFMEYYRDENGNLTRLSKQNVDTGMGFERMCSVIQGKSSVYDTDLFSSIMQLIQSKTSKTYSDNNRRFRIIADHARTACMLVNDGLIPSNIGAGYVLRMIIRRMTYNIMLLRELNESEYQLFISDFLDIIQNLRNFNKLEIIRVVTDEIKLFQKTIQNGMQILNGLLNEARNLVISGLDAFKLYDTYGFPLELTREIALEHGLSIDETGFKLELEKAKEKSRQSTKDMFKKGIDRSKYLEGVPQTEFIGYDCHDCDDSKIIKEITLENGQKVLIFDKTPFYPEMGGQMGDFGSITLENGEIKKITSVQKFAGVILHFIG